jgi:hypothetical protein
MEPTNAVLLLSRRVITDCTKRWNSVGFRGSLAFLSFAQGTVVGRWEGQNAAER